MSNREEIVKDLSSHYTINIMRAFGGKVDPASNAIQEIAKCINEVYRYFEPSFFEGDFYVCKKFDDSYCFKEDDGALVYDKNIFLNRTTGTIVIQTFNDNTRLHLWENKNIEDILEEDNILIYHYSGHKEFFHANGSKIDITILNDGSRFASQYNDLVNALLEYSQKKIFYSSCEHFSESWANPKDKRIFFRGGGSGNNIPEKFMQLSLHEFLDSHFVRGIKMESSREYNIVGDFKKPKPVDIKIHWREANRTAIIEVKLVGTIKKDSDAEIYDYKIAKVHKGLVQLKEYFDSARQDSPTTILKAFLIVIDGRRNNLIKDAVTVNTKDGMHFKDKELKIKEDKKYYNSIVGFEKPIRMFSCPICD